MGNLMPFIQLLGEVSARPRSYYVASGAYEEAAQARIAEDSDAGED
jgi:hypothetical protein